MNLSNILQTFTNIGHKIIKVIWLFNSKNINLQRFSNIIIIIYFLKLISMLMMYPIEPYYKYDGLTMDILYHCDIYKILTIIFKIDIFPILISVFTFHLIILIIYSVLTIFVDTFSNRNSAIYNSLIYIIDYINKIYIWVLYAPSMDLCLYCLRNGPKSYAYIILSVITIIFIISYQLILYFTRMNTDFIPKDEFATRFTYVPELVILSQTIYLFIIYFLSNNNQLVIYIASFIIALIKVIQYIRDLPFCNEKISITYGTLCMIYLYIVCLLCIYQHPSIKFTLYIFIIIGIGLIIPISILLRQYMIKKMLLCQHYIKLSNSRFYYLMKYLLLLIKTPDLSLKFSTFYLIIFLRNHIYQCKEDNCPCKNQNNLLNNKILKNPNVLEKSITIIMYKSIIIQIITKAFDEKIKSSPGNYNAELKLLQALFLIFYAKKNIKAYILINSIMENKRQLIFKQKFVLRNIKDKMEKMLNDGGNNMLHSQAIIFYQSLDNLKDQISHLMNMYLEFFYGLMKYNVQIDHIMLKGREVIKYKKAIYDNVKYINTIYSHGKELYFVLAMYALLQTTDDLNDYIIKQQVVDKYLKLKSEDNANTNAHPSYIHVKYTMDSLFNEQNCIIFINLFDQKFGKISSVTPGFTKIFGYPSSEAQYLVLESLMPEIFTKTHRNFLTNIINQDNDSSVNFTSATDMIYGLSKEKYLLPLGKKLKIETLNNELCITAFIHQKYNEKELIMTYINGGIMNFSQGLKKYLMSKDNNINLMANFNIAYIIPKLILAFAIKDNRFKNILSDEDFISKLAFLNKMVDIHDTKKLLTCDNIEDDVHMIFPKNKAFYTEINTMHKKLANSTGNIFEDDWQFTDILRVINHIYNMYDKDNIIVCQANITYRNIYYKKANLHVKVLEIGHFREISDSIHALKSKKIYLKSLIKYFAYMDSSNSKLASLSDAASLKSQIVSIPLSEIHIQPLEAEKQQIQANSKINDHTFINSDKSSQREQNNDEAFQGENIDRLEALEYDQCVLIPEYSTTAKRYFPSKLKSNEISATFSMKNANFDHSPNITDRGLISLPMSMTDRGLTRLPLNITDRDTKSITDRNQSNTVDQLQLFSSKPKPLESILELKKYTPGAAIDESSSDYKSNSITQLKQQARQQGHHHEEMNSKTGTFQKLHFDKKKVTSICMALQGGLDTSKVFLNQMEEKLHHDKKNVTSMSITLQDGLDTSKVLLKQLQLENDGIIEDKSLFSKSFLNSLQPIYPHLKNQKHLESSPKNSLSIIGNINQTRRARNPKKEDQHTMDNQIIRNLNQIKQQSSHNSKTKSETSVKIFKSLLFGETIIPGLGKMNQFGYISLLILLTVIIILSTIVIINLNKYRDYINTSDFGSTLISGITFYSKYVTLKLLEFNGMFSTLNIPIDTNSNISISILSEKYSSYKSTLSHGLYATDILSQSNINYLDHNNLMSIWELSPDQQEIALDLAFFSSIQMIENQMEQVVNTINSTLYSFEDIYPSTVYFFLKNYPTYFDTLTSISRKMGYDASGSRIAIDMKAFAIISLIICIIVAIAFLAPIYPIYRLIEKNKEKGLSFLTRFADNDIFQVLKVIKTILLAMQNQQALFKARKIQDDHNTWIKSTRIIIHDNSKNTKRNFRNYEIRKSNPFIFLIIIFIVLALLGTYYFLYSIRIINHDENFNQFLYELNLGSAAFVCTNTNYYLSYLALSLYTQSDNWKTYYRENYMPIWDYCSRNFDSMKKYWINIDAYIANNSDITEAYIENIYNLKYHDLCNFINKDITKFSSANDMLKQCKTAFQSATEMGIVDFITTLDVNFKNIMNLTNISNFNQNMTRNIILGMDFQGFDTLFIYSDLIMNQYVLNLKSIITDIINFQIIEMYIFFSIGFIMLSFGYKFIWVPFLTFTKQEFLFIKKLLCIFPIHIIIDNNYVKKWLLDNTQHSS